MSSLQRTGKSLANYLQAIEILNWAHVQNLTKSAKHNRSINDCSAQGMNIWNKSHHSCRSSTRSGMYK